MRTVVVLAAFLLALALFAEHAVPSRPESATGRADRALEILVGAKGALLPAALLGTGPERVGEVIRLGDLTLVASQPHAGLRSALWTPERGLVDQRTHALAETDEEALELLDTVLDAPRGSLLVLASSGSLVPPGATGRAALARAAAELGAHERPGTHTVESWALIALRLEAGWVPLAEGHSEESGVALTFTLARELDSYAGFVGDFVRVRAPREREVFLQEELHHSATRSAGVELTREAVVGARILPAIRMRCTRAGAAPLPSSVSWPEVTLDDGSGFHAWVGLEDGPATGGGGVAFELWLDGARVGGVSVAPGDPWEVLQLDLRAFAGRRVTLELRATSGAGTPGATALWGVPVLFHGYARSPQEVWAERR